MIRISLMFLFFSVALTVSLFAEDSPDGLIKKSDAVLYGQSFTADLEISVYKNGQLDQTTRMQAFLKGNHKMILIYFYPTRDKDRALLKDGDDLWLYMPSNRKFLKIGSRQRMGESDFNYGDILNVNLSEDYDAKIISETNIQDQPSYELELLAKTPEVTYAKIICFIRKADLAPVKREFYTKTDKLMKEMVFADYQGVRPMKFIMSGTLNKTEYSTMVFSNLKLNVALEDEMFTKSFIERRR